MRSVGRSVVRSRARGMSPSSSSTCPLRRSSTEKHWIVIGLSGLKDKRDDALRDLRRLIRRLHGRYLFLATDQRWASRARLNTRALESRRDA